MADAEKVIKGLELCTEITQDGCMMLCPYKDEQDETYSGFCEQVLKCDALDLLKSQQAEITEKDETRAELERCSVARMKEQQEEIERLKEMQRVDNCERCRFKDKCLTGRQLSR